LKHKWKVLAATAAAGIVAVGAYNATIYFPVNDALRADPRNSGLTIAAYRTYAVHPSDITLNVLGAEAAAPLDVFRIIFQTAKALKDSRFGNVHLVRGTTHVYTLTGADFQQLGQEFAMGQNPVFMVRTLPEKLLLPDGRKAFGEWTGGLLGVVSRQMEDANEAARTWVSGA